MVVNEIKMPSEAMVSSLKQMASQLDEIQKDHEISQHQHSLLGQLYSQLTPESEEQKVDSSPSDSWWSDNSQINASISEKVNIAAPSNAPPVDNFGVLRRQDASQRLATLQAKLWQDLREVFLGLGFKLLSLDDGNKHVLAIEIQTN